MRLLNSSSQPVGPETLATAHVAITDIDVGNDGEIVANVRVCHAPSPDPITVRFGSLDDDSTLVLKELQPLKHVHKSIPEAEIPGGLLDFSPKTSRVLAKIDVQGLAGYLLWIRNGQRLASGFAPPDFAQIFVKDLGGKETPFHVCLSDTVSSLRQKVQDMNGWSPDIYRLIFNKQPLEDDRTLSDHEVTHGSTILLALRLRGQGDFVRVHVLGMNPRDWSTDVQDGFVPITVRFDESITIRTGATGEVEEGAIQVMYGPRTPLWYSTRQCSTRLPGTAGYDEASHTLTFIPQVPIPPSSQVHVVISPQCCFRRGFSLSPGANDFWFSTRWDTKRLLVQSPAGTNRPLVRCQFRVQTSSPFRDLIHAVATAIDVEPCQLATLHVCVGRSMVQIRTAADVSKLRSDDVVMVLLQGERMDATDSATGLSQDFPAEFVCPITLAVMQDPVICADGNTYDRVAIERWLQTHTTSPNTNLPLANAHLIPNIALRAAIRRYLTGTPT